jgi:hypothetical protein
MRLIGYLTVGAALMLGSAAQAADWYTGSAVPETPESWIIDVDASTTVTSKDTVFAGVSATIAAVENLQTSGWRGRVEGLAGRYSYLQYLTNTKIRSQQESGSLMAGYEWVARDTTVALWIGLDIKNTSLSMPDPNNTVVGTGAGVKFAGQFYTRLSDDMMASGYASYSTLHGAYYARGKVGWSVGGNVYLGPELSALGDDFYRQYRIGAHITGVKFGRLGLGIAGGFLHDDVQGSGAYGTLDARIGF